MNRRAEDLAWMAAAAIAALGISYIFTHWGMP